MTKPYLGSMLDRPALMRHRREARGTPRRRQSQSVLLALAACVLVSPALPASDLHQAGEMVIEHPAWAWNMAPWDSEKVVSYGDFQYTVYWNTAGALTLARRHIATNETQRLVFPDASLPSNDDPHQSTAIGISPRDGRLHLSYGQWASALRYRSSVAGLIEDPPPTLATSHFSGEKAMVGQHETRVTYPRFFNLNDGTLLFLHRYWTSHNGDSFLNRYNAQTGAWERIGMLFSRAGTFTDPMLGSSGSRNAYLNDIVVDSRNRIHITWTWREDPGHETNHDLHYIYSDDEGKTWKNNAGRTVANLPGGVPVRVDSLGIRVAEIPVYSWLINQDTMVVDSHDQPHVVTHHSTVPTAVTAERNLHYVHYWREQNGEWRSGWIDPPEVPHTSFRRRGALAIDPDDNLHFLVIEGGLRYFHARADEGWQIWRQKGFGNAYSGQGLRYDRRLWRKNQVLYAAATKSSSNAFALPVFQWNRPGPRYSLGDFSEDGKLEDWRLLKHLEGQSESGALRLAFQGNDPHLRRGGLGIDADRFRYLLVRMKHAGDAGQGAVFFVTHSDFSWSYSKSRTFALGAPDGQYHDYLIDLGLHSRWRGGIAGLRIDPAEEARGGDTASIERIVLWERTPLEEWRRTHFSEAELADAALSGDGAAPAGDGVANLVKFALGLDPRAPASREALPEVRRTADGALELRFIRPKETGLRYRVEVSSDLERWSSGPGATEVVEIADLGDREEIATRDLSSSGQSRRFIRLRVDSSE